MSNLPVAEADVLVLPNTAAFRSTLVAQLAAIEATLPPLTIPTVAIPPTNLPLITTQANAASGALSQVAAAQTAGAAAARSGARATAEHARSMSQLQRGAGATGLSLLNIRGATLAASSQFLAGAAAVALFAKSLQGAMSLEQELSVFRVTTRATADEMQRVSEEARQLGRDIRLPGVTSRDAAEAMTELARAGLSVEESLSGARGVLQLAAAAQIDNAEATLLAASALNSFGLAGDDAVRVADVLANAANEAQGSISDMGLALRQSAAVGRQVGLSLEETTAALTLLARNGLQSSDAGTALRTALIRLINPTKQASNIIRQLGLDLRDAQGNIRPEVFAEFAEATRDLSKAQRDAALAIVFGQDAIRAAAILGREGAAAFEETTAALQRQGTAAELAGARAVGLGGKLSALQSNLETLGTQLGGKITPAIGLFVDNINEMVTAAGTGVDAISDLANELQGLSTSILDAIPGANSLVDALIEIEKVQIAGPAGLAARAINRLRDTFTTDSSEIRGDAAATERDVRNLFRTLGEGPLTSTALFSTITALDEMADKLKNGDAEAQRLAAIIREIIVEVKRLQGVGPTVIDIFAKFNPDQIEKETDRATKKILEGFAHGGPAMSEVGEFLIESMFAGMQKAIPKLNFDPPALSVERVTARFEESLIDAQIANDRAAQLNILRRENALIEEQLAGGVERRDKRLDLKRRQEEIQNEIESIEEEMASEARQHSAQIESTRRERDEAILRSIGLEESRRQNALIIAETTPALRDDLAAQIALRNFYRRSIAEVRRTVKDAQVAAQEIASLTRDLIRANAEIKATRAEMREQRRQERLDRIAERREGLELDVEIAQTTGSVAAQRRALQAEIRFYQERIRATRAGSNARKRWLLELRRAQKELKELKGEEDKTRDSFAELSFEFLQTQQGFAANLLGNLIPSSATGGLVGGREQAAQPERQVLQAAALDRARESTTTAGQTAIVIDVLRQMLQELRSIRSGNAHPEARFQRRHTGGAMEML